MQKRVRRSQFPVRDQLDLLHVAQPLNQLMPAAAIDGDEHPHAGVTPHCGQDILQQCAVGGIPGLPRGWPADPCLQDTDRVADVPKRAGVNRARPVRPELEPAQQTIQPPQDGAPWTSDAPVRAP